MRPRREELGLVGVGVESSHPRRHQLGVGLLLGSLDAVDDEAVRVTGVAGVDGGDGRLEATVAGSHAFGRRSTRRTRTPSSSDPSASAMIPKSW